MREYSEDALIEQPAIALFNELGWATVNCYDEKLGSNGTLGRETRSEVVLAPRLRSALRKLNPTAPEAALEQAITELTRDHSMQALASANRDVYRLVRDGVRVLVRDPRGEEATI